MAPDKYKKILTTGLISIFTSRENIFHTGHRCIEFILIVKGLANPNI
jgi:hypothetical protein